MNYKLNKIIPFQNIFDILHEKLQKNVNFYSGFYVSICIKPLTVQWKLFNLLKTTEKSIKSTLISRKSEIVP